MQSFRIQTHKRHTHGLTLHVELQLPPTPQKNKLRGEGAGRAAGGRSTARRGRKWVSVFILLSLIPQGCTNRQELSPNPPTDVRAHCLFQSWQKGSKGHLSRSSTSSPHPFIPLPFRGALHLPHKPL